MSDAEYAAIMRRAVIMIVTASIKKFSLSWLDFMPRDAATAVVVWPVTTSATVERG